MLVAGRAEEAQPLMLTQAFSEHSAHLLDALNFHI